LMRKMLLLELSICLKMSVKDPCCVPLSTHACCSDGREMHPGWLIGRLVTFIEDLKN
jgi:hypothetical protein